MNRWRGPIGVEGVTSPDGRHIKPGALEFELPLPLVSDQIEYGKIGTVETIDRRDDGVLVGAGEIVVQPEKFGLAISADSAESDIEEGEGRTIVFAHARIRAIYLTNEPLWPECRIEIVE